MTNLIGEYECKVDAKGRLLVPSGLRKQFSSEAEGKLFVKRGIENCLELYQKHDWEFVYKIPSSGDILYTVHIPSKSKVDAVERFKREHPNALICRGIRKGERSMSIGTLCL